MTDANGPENETVLVTGGSGYLAGWVIADLLEQGYSVRTTLRQSSKAEAMRRAVAEQVGDLRASAIEVVEANLLDDASWNDAMRGVDFLIHTASPLGFRRGQNLIETARGGTARVLRAAARAGVRRAVVTSSGVTAIGPDSSLPATSETWAEVSDRPEREYNDSKILAEQEAWSIAEETGLEVVAILPTFMQGPMLGTPNSEGSVEVLRRTLTGGVPALPNVGWDIVDVRDIAKLHILALTNPDAAGKRFLGSGRWLWWRDIAAILRNRMPEEAKKVPTRVMPDIAVKILGRMNSQMATLRLDLGRQTHIDSRVTTTTLGWRPRAVEDTIVDTARALLHKAASH